MKRMGTAEDVASLVLFLLSDESGYITGAEVAIDGCESVPLRRDFSGWSNYW